MTAAYKRRNYFINKEFQGRHIFNAFLLVAFGSILFALVFTFFSSNTLSITYDNYQLRLGTTPGILLNKIVSGQWLVIVLGGLLITIITLFLSHRVAGPFFRFEKTLDAMTAKDISVRVTLRPKDEGKELALKINNFNEVISSSLNRIRSNADQIVLCHDRIDSNESNGEDIAFLKSELQKIKQHNLNTISILDEFNLTKE
ncbi:MAG: methyl-accepting chemotaxis protein [Pseudomonadota bacterium]